MRPRKALISRAAPLHGNNYNVSMVKLIAVVSVSYLSKLRITLNILQKTGFLSHINSLGDEND